MIYSSITPYVHMLYTAEHDEEHICLDFSHSRGRRDDMYGYDSFGAKSTVSLTGHTLAVRIEADGRRSGVSDSRQMVKR